MFCTNILKLTIKNKIKKILFTIIIHVGILSTAFSQTPSYVPTNGLIGWWGFNGNPNHNTNAALNGNVVGAVLCNDRNGNANSAYSFNGTSDYIFINANGATGITNVAKSTVSTWIKNTGNADLQRDYDSYFQFGGILSSNAPHSLAYASNYNLNEIAVYNNCLGSNGIISNTNNAWSHVVIVQDSLLQKTYVNGILINTTNSNYINCFAGGDNIIIGAAPGDVQWFTGNVDDIGFWNRALTQNEVSSLFNSTATALSTITNYKDINIYPNPSLNKTINIDLGNNELSKGGNIIILNQLGQIVSDFNITTQQLKLDLSNLIDNQCYIIKIADRNNAIVYINKFLLN